MARIPQVSSGIGSLRLLQRAVNDRPDVLNAAIRSKLLIEGDITWVSPLATDQWAEYRDEDFLRRLGLDPAAMSVPLHKFWPARGPQWDALARTTTGELILLEAKANLPELLSSPSQAGPGSLRLIKRSLKRTQAGFRARPGIEWHLRFYQYANRLAHLYYLWRLNQEDAMLVFLYFVNASDVDGPASAAEWMAASEVMHEALGVRGRLPATRVAEVFIDVGELAKPRADSHEREPDATCPVCHVILRASHLDKHIDGVHHAKGRVRSAWAADESAREREEAAPIILRSTHSVRGSPGQACSRCGDRGPGHREFTSSSRGRVTLCSGCLPKVIERSFPGGDAMNRAVSGGAFSARGRRH